MPTELLSDPRRLFDGLDVSEKEWAIRLVVFASAALDLGRATTPEEQDVAGANLTKVIIQLAVQLAKVDRGITHPGSTLPIDPPAVA